MATEAAVVRHTLREPYCQLFFTMEFFFFSILKTKSRVSAHNTQVLY
jgi:hypothetical protein